MITRAGVASLLTVGVVATSALAGCSKAATSKPSDLTSSTIGDSGSGVTSTTASATPTAPAVPTTTAPAVPASLGGTCDDLLPVSAVNIALHRAIVGRTAFVLGVAEPNIGRLIYINCRYGLPVTAKASTTPKAGSTPKPTATAAAATPQVEVGVSLYDSAAQAARRVAGTIEDYESNAAVPSKAAVGIYPGTVVVGYGDPTLVVAAGPRTIAVTVKKAVFPGTITAGLTALAVAALDATAQFTGVPGVSVAAGAPTGASSEGPAAGASPTSS